MRNRPTATIIAIIVFFLFGCPVILLLCNAFLALSEMITNYQVQIIGYGYNAPYWFFGSCCLGFFALFLTLVIIIIVLRRKN